MTIPNHSVDVAVLGGGPGGYVASLIAARRGARVVLIEKERVPEAMLEAALGFRDAAIHIHTR